MEAAPTEPGIVLFRPGALGDTMLTMDAIAALRRYYPHRTIELVGHADGARLLQHWGIVDRARSFDDPEVTALFMSPPRVAPAWRNVQCVVLWLRDGDDIAQAFTSETSVAVVGASPEPESGHVADHLVETLRPLVGPELDRGAPAMAARWSGGASRAVVLHPGSGAARKNWSPEGFAGLARAFLAEDRPVALLAGPADDAVLAAVLGSLTPGERSRVALPTTASIVDLARVLATCALYIGNDSGVSHVAGRLGVPTVAIFGATDPARWAPRGARVLIAGGEGRWPSLDEVIGSARRIEREAEAALPRVPRSRLDEDGADEQRE